MTSLCSILALLHCTFMLCYKHAHGWRSPKSRIHSGRASSFGIPTLWKLPPRGGSSAATTTTTTTTVEEQVLLDSFQQEVHKMRRELKDETDSFVDNFRREILEAKQRSKRARAKKHANEHDNTDAASLNDEQRKIVNVDEFSLEQDFSDGLDDDLAPQQNGERIAVFEETDDFVVGDSDEEPDSVMKRMKESASASSSSFAVKLDDVLAEKVKEADEKEEEAESASHDYLDNALPSDKQITSSAEKPKRKKKNKKKAKKNLVPPKSAPGKKSKKTKTKKKAKLAEEKEVIRTALSSKTAGDQLSVLKSSRMQNLVKGVVLAVLLALTLLALKIVENSVTPSAAAASAAVVTK